MERSLRLLGMAKKAGLIAVGSDDACAAARTGRAKLMLLASDASEGALKRARYSAELGGVKCVSAPYTAFEIGKITGRGSPGTVAVLDEGLAAGLLRDITQTGA